MIGTGYYSSYIIYVLPALLISLAAQMAVKSSFSKYSKVYCAMTGAQAARRVLEINGVSGVRIERVSGQLTDHFDPRTNVIRLSESVYNAASISAVGVAAHEAGHAVQYAKGYVPIKLRSAILPVSQIGSQLSMPLLLMGIILSFELLINLGIIFFCAALLFQLVTLPVEFNASRRAMSAIESGYLLTDERSVKGARSVLRAAAMTYVAAVIVSVMQLLRLLSLAGRRRR